MTRRFVWALGLGGVGIALVALSSRSPDGAARADSAKGPMIAHNVYFSLKEKSPEVTKKVVVACNQYLSEHAGTEFFAAGTLSDLDRPVNDRDWDVGLHIVFKDKAALEAYLKHDRHTKFVDEFRDTWSKVRVFDTDFARD